MSDNANELGIATRLWFAWACFFRVFFDAEFAYRAFKAQSPELVPASTAPPPQVVEKPVERIVERIVEKVVEAPRAADTSSALQLLALFQREGRFVDFLEQDVAAFPDADIGAAARVVHEGCRKALRAHAKIAPIRTEEEGARVTLAAGFSPAEVKLTGNVQGAAPYKGVLVHRGWRASDFALPTALQGHDVNVLAPAEVEL